MKSVMQHSFSQVPNANIERSSFDRSHGLKTTFDAGWLVPVFTDEVLPGDTFNLDMTAFARLTTPIVPIMDNLFLDSFFFFVPLRLIWTNSKKFFGENANPGDYTEYTVPQMTSPAGGYAIASLSDYFGLPTEIAGYAHSSLYHRAYNLIYNEWFRDENLNDHILVDLDDGPDDPADYILKRRNKRQDYFTACLPWPYKGTALTVPLGTSATVSSVNPTISASGALSYTDGTHTRSMTSVNSTDALNLDSAIGGSGAGAMSYVSGLQVSSVSGQTADLSTATAATINQWREVFQIQRLLERDARGGTRYTELMRSHFGVTSPDSRLQRPEYLGGGSTIVGLNPIAQTSATSGANALGQLAAIGTVRARGHGFTQSFTEHGIVIGLVNVRADLTYQQGVDRNFLRQTRYDYFWPALAHLGEQVVTLKELYTQPDATDTGATGTPDNDRVFGYQERYAEYRYKPSRITGQFRSTTGTPLDIWHLSQEFSAVPALDSNFIQDNPPLDRVIAVSTQPHFYFDSYFRYRCARPLPTYGVPGLIDHF